MSELLLKPSFYVAATAYIGTAANMVMGGSGLFTVVGLAATIASTAVLVHER